MDLLKLDVNQTTRRVLESPLRGAKWNFAAGRKAKWDHQIVIFGAAESATGIKNMLGKLLDESQVRAALRSNTQLSLVTSRGLVHVLRVAPSEDGESDYGRFRDMTGARFRELFQECRRQKSASSIGVHLVGLNAEETLGALVGIGLSHYSFRNVLRSRRDEQDPKLFFTSSTGKIDRNLIDASHAIVSGMNLARHLANLPASGANPQDLAQFFKNFFSGRRGLTVEVWDVARIKKENMGLLLGVGNGSQWGARFVHLRYRPQGGSKRKPLAFVGKGVTFDTGGLDIKTAAGMRLMKKDMSGVAIMAGLCHFVTNMSLKTPCDFYLPLAENSVSDRATRPGDVHLSRAGHYVEIDNTDAEGRLVMADAIDYAVTRKNADAPAALIDVSTLTGAMRVAVGLDVAGFFSNDDELVAEAESAAQKMGEMAWRMPLVKKYERELNSEYADFRNCSDSGFGGAITAALFLQKFVRDTSWLHFDVMAWNKSPAGALSEGSNAQCFQILAGMLLARE